MPAARRRLPAAPRRRPRRPLPHRRQGLQHRQQGHHFRALRKPLAAGAGRAGGPQESQQAVGPEEEDRFLDRKVGAGGVPRLRPRGHSRMEQGVREDRLPRRHRGAPARKRGFRPGRHQLQHVPLDHDGSRLRQGAVTGQPADRRDHGRRHHLRRQHGAGLPPAGAAYSGAEHGGPDRAGRRAGQPDPGGRRAGACSIAEPGRRWRRWAGTTARATRRYRARARRAPASAGRA